MKKNIITGCSIFLAITIVIILLVGSFITYRGYNFFNNNAKRVEEIINNKLPAGYLPVSAIDYQDKALGLTKYALLRAKNDHYIMLLKGPLVTSKEDKQKYFDNLKDDVQPFEHPSNFFSYSPDGFVDINGKKLDKYRINIKSDIYDRHGIALFINYSDHTLFFACYAEVNMYDNNIALNFIKAIK